MSLALTGLVAVVQRTDGASDSMSTCIVSGSTASNGAMPLTFGRGVGEPFISFMKHSIHSLYIERIARQPRERAQGKLTNLTE